MTAPAFGWDQFVGQGAAPHARCAGGASPDDFGGVAVYLASDASTYHTGDTFVIDGGYLIF